MALTKDIDLMELAFSGPQSISAGQAKDTELALPAGRLLGRLLVILYQN